MNICLAGARAEASRRNGAKSRGPKTPAGKARSSQNALKHGLRAEKFVVVGGEDAAAFEALETALIDELAPEGALQRLLAARIARAAWRLERAERIEGELFVRHADRERNLGLALIRDGHGSRSFDTLLRYRGSALAELWRALRLLKALQAEQQGADACEAVPCQALPQLEASAPSEVPIEPEARTKPRETAAPPAAETEAVPRQHAAAAAPGQGGSRTKMPSEPEDRRKPRGSAPPTAGETSPQPAGNSPPASPPSCARLGGGMS